MAVEAVAFPYLPTLARLMLALGIGLFVGAERERRRKEAGLRTFGFASLLGAIGGLLGTPFAEISLLLLGVLVVLLNVEGMRTEHGAELTTSAALVVTGFVGLMAGQGHTFTPTAVGIATAGLLAWKEPLAGFSVALTEAEFRSAVLLAIIAFVVYPTLPIGSVDPWRLIEPRSAWITVILIAGLGFANYVLLKLFGARGIELTGFLGGLVNSTVTANELARRVRDSGTYFLASAQRGLVLAIAAMIARNALILGLLARDALQAVAVPFALMFVTTAAAGWRTSRAVTAPDEETDEIMPTLPSPLSLMSALQFGLVFLAIQVAGTFAQRGLGNAGLYVVSAIGGVISSASTVAAAANLLRVEPISPSAVGVAAFLASLVSAWINLPVIARVGRNPALTRRIALVLAALTAAAGVGALIGLRL